jgi:hypothetical protein
MAESMQGDAIWLPPNEKAEKQKPGQFSLTGFDCTSISACD